MSEFMSELDVTLMEGLQFNGRPVWRLSHALCYRSNVAGKSITVPAGFYTDFASVPRIPFIYEALGDCAQRAAVIHDWLYFCGALSRKQSDVVFKEAMLVSSVSKWKALTLYVFVRLLGKSRYKG